MLDSAMGFLQANRGPLIVAVVVLAGWLFLRSPATPLDSVAALDQRLGQGKPVVLEFFANT